MAAWSRGRPVQRVVSLAAACVVVGAAAVHVTAVAHAAASASLRGTVTAAGRPLAAAQVTLLGASRNGATPLGHVTTNASGGFTISYAHPGSAGALYVDVRRSAFSRLRLRAVVGVGSGGALRSTTQTTVTVNELTTVAASYALAQFSDPDGIAGPTPGLENAAATASNLADPATGKAGSVVTDADNGTKNDTLATLGTLANLVSLCAPGSSPGCAALLRLATPPGGSPPTDTAQAMVNLARNPTLATAGLYSLTQGATVYQPALAAPPSAWILVLLYTEPQLYASGRIAIDAKGNAWSSVNWLPGTQTASTYATVLDPVGRSTLGSPISGGGMKAGAWGAAIAPAGGSVWMGSFGGDAISQYSPAGKPLSPESGWTNGQPDHPQGVAVDQKGNVWIANNYGPESAPDQGDVIVYPGGDPSKALRVTGGGLNHPFAIQIDGFGRAWVTNAGLGGAKLVNARAATLIGKFGGSVTVIGTDFKPTSFSPIQSGSFKSPLGLSIDSKNNAWVANYFGSTVTQIGPDGAVAGVYELPNGTLPWSQAIDGSDRVWVAGFAQPNVWLLCGANTGACPRGSATGAVLSPRLGFGSKAFQHHTSIQIDQAGNVWLSNNRSQLVPPVGGTGIAEMIGAGTPVCAPLTPLPTRPSAGSAASCPPQAAEAPPSSLTGGSLPTAAWVAIAAALAALAATAGLLRRRRQGKVVDK